MRRGNEARVGLVIVLALALATTGIIFLRGVGLRPDVYYARLEGGASLAAGSEVRLQGVKVGVVQDVTLDAQQKPVARLTLVRQDPPIRLLKSYTYRVATSGIIGENYLDVSGPFTPGAPVYAVNNEGDPIRAGSNAGLLSGLSGDAGQLITQFKGTVSRLNTTLDRVNNGILNSKNQVLLAQSLRGVATLTRQAGQSFGPNGVKFGLGDPAAQRSLNATLANTALAAGGIRQVIGQAGAAAREATFAAHNLRGLTGSLGGTLNENRGVLRGLLANLNRASNNVAGLTQTLDATLRTGGLQQNAQATFSSLRRAANNVEATTAGFRTIATDPKTQKTLRETLATLRDSVGALQATAQTIQKTVGDPAVQEALKGTLLTLNTTAQTLQTTTENLRDATAGFKNVLGDVGVQNDLKAIPAELRRTLEATGDTAQRINSLLGGRKARKATTPNSTAGGAVPGSGTSENDTARPLGVDFTLRHFLDPAKRGGRDVTGRIYGDATFNSELLGGPFRLGVSNIGDGTDLTLQSGRFLGRNGDLRYGIYRSKLGVGADYRLGRFSLEGNLWNPNDRSANAYLGFRLSPGVTVLAGRENIGNTRTNAVAVRLGR